MFCGADNVDFQGWLNTYEHRSTHNRWHPSAMLANVDMSLRGAARICFRTNEGAVTSLDTCKSKLRELFGKYIGCRNKVMDSRVQTPTERYVTYMMDVLSISHKADGHMAEASKVRHILQGITCGAFNLLLCKDCTTAKSVIKGMSQVWAGKRTSHKYKFKPASQHRSYGVVQRYLSRWTSTLWDYRKYYQATRREFEAMAPTTLPQPETPLPSFHLIQVVVLVNRKSVLW